MFRKLKPLSPYLWRYRGQFALGALCVLLNNGVWIFFPQVIRRAMDDLNSGVKHEKIYFYAALLLGIALVKGLFQYLTRWVLIGISREIEFDLRNDLFRKLESLSYDYYQRTRTGDIMARATNDLNAVRMLLGPAIMYSANTLIFTAGALFFMLRISPKLTLFAFLPLPIATTIVQYFGRKIHERFEAIQAMFSEISARAQENFSAARLIRAYVQEDAEIALFEGANEEYIGRSLKLIRIMGMLWPTLEVLLGIAVVIVLWLGGREVIQHRITVGQFVAYNTYMVQLTWPVIAFGWVINLFMRGTASLERIDEVLKEQPRIADAPNARARDIVGSIELSGISFSYGQTQVLHDINLSIPSGTSLAIVGPTGSGKTTLVSLIPRIHDAQGGILYIDDVGIHDHTLESLRKSIGFVPQETFLFSDTVRENIAFGVESATEQQIRRAAGIAHIASDIENFPLGYQTVIGERGITLSGGQKQRTAIARALIRDPRILILDDALASVDTYTEERILTELREVMSGRTTIFISHRVSTVKNADQIIVLEHGRIVEAGTHDELLGRGGYYTDLFHKQLLEEELASA